MKHRMNYPSKKRKGMSFIIDLSIVVLIAIGLIFMNFFVINRFSELEDAGNKAMFINDDIPIIDEESAISEIVDYQSNAYNMLEVYDENLDLMISIQFNTNHPVLPSNDISNYPDIMEQLQDQESGRFVVERENDDGSTINEEISFNWLLNNRGEKRLIIIYSTKPVVENLWIFSLVCYGILILVMILLIRFIYRRSNDKIAMYNYISTIDQ